VRALLLLTLCAGASAAPSRLDTLAVGDTRTGELAAGDQKLPAGEYFDRWGFIGHSGEEVTIDLTAEAFDTYLILQRPDGSQFDNDDRAPGDYNSQISQRLSLEGRYAVIVSSYRAGAAGPYALSLRPGLAPPPPDPDSIAEQAPEVPVALGYTASASLGQGDTRLHSGRLVDIYTFGGEIGHQVAIDMRSTVIDSHLTLIGPDGTETVNDDIAPGRLDSHIETILPESGLYRLRASSYGAGEVGPYEISLFDTTRPLVLGAPVSERIAADRRDLTFLLDPPRGDHEDSLRIQLKGDPDAGDLDLEVLCHAGQRMATAPSPWVSIGDSRSIGPEEEVIVGTHREPPYLVRVLAADGRASGFRLEVAPGPAPEPLAVPQTVDGTLAGRQRTLFYEVTAPAAGDLLARLEAKGGPVQLRWALHGRHRTAPWQTAGDFAVAPVEEGDQMVLAVTEEPTLTAGQGEIEFRLEIDQVLAGAPLLAAPVSARMRPGGPHAVGHALSPSPGGLIQVSLLSDSPALALSLVRADTGEILARTAPAAGRCQTALAAPPPGSPCLALVTQSGAISDAQSYMLTLDHGAENRPFDFAPGPPVESRITGPAGITSHFEVLEPGLYRLRVSSKDGDSPLGLEVLGAESPSDTPKTSRVTAEKPEIVFLSPPGGGSRWVRIFDPSGAQRNFTLEAQRITDTPLARGDPGSAELWGIFAGVSHYPGGREDLPFCAEDAIRLCGVFQREGFIAPDHAILLTDGGATHAALGAAFRAMASRVGPEDEFVFFFSGHGGQSPPSDDSPEIDRRDEFFCPADTDQPGGDVTDDELARWLDALRASVSMVFLDSCNAGGFRDDLASVRGRVGLFASEEDLESFTYEEQKSGGILSHVLVNGFKGRADLNGDGRISAGEITDYVLTQMPLIHISDSAHTSRQAQHPEWCRTVAYDAVLVTMR
jgi:hypothetical protein